MSEIGKIAHVDWPWHVPMPQIISLAEHDRTLKRVLAELHTAQVERAHVVDVLTTFKTSPRTISSISKVLDLLDELMNGPKSALCGPKEMGCPPLS